MAVRKGQTLLLLTLLLVLALVVTACGGQTTGTGDSENRLDEIKERGVITFATDGAYPPMEFTDNNNELKGFDVDLGKAIAAEIGVEYEPMIVQWEGIIPGLAQGKYDLIMSSMNITDERATQVDFVHYYDMGQYIVVATGNPNNIQTLDDLSGMTVAVQTGTTNEDVARTIEGTEVKVFETFTDAMLEVKAGRADATILDEPVALYYITTAPDDYQIVGDAFDRAPVGIAVQKNQPELKKAVEDALETLKQNGTYDEIYANWFGSN